MNHKASCSCGQLSLTYNDEIKRISICHCFECQKRTGSVFGVQTRFEKSKTVIKGNSSVYQRTGDEGTDVMSMHFCPKCGSTVYWEAAWLGESIAVAIGTLCNPNLPTPVVHVYGSRKHQWVKLPEGIEEYFG